MKRIVLSAFVVVALAGCAQEGPETPVGTAAATVAPPAPAFSVAKMEAPPIPVGPGAGEPFLASTGGTLVASWLERSDDGGAALKFSRFENAAWTTPVSVASGDDFFVNWADVPSVVALGGDRMIAHWLQKSGAGTYSYDVQLAVSDDRGSTWKTLGPPHATEVNSEYGFVSIEPDGSGGAWISWLDGRGMSGSHGHEGGAMAARIARVNARNEIVDETLLDDRTCECCQTGMAIVEGAPVVVWRDRSEDEIRDVVFARRTADGSWTAPARVQEDGWKIPGCPVNGPQIHADGSNVAVASFTAAGEQPEVKVAFSSDEGKTFSSPVIVSDAAPLGRVDVLTRGGRALITWVEKSGDAATVNAAVVGPSGVEQRLELGRTSAARSSGFPRAAMHEGDAWIAWTVPGGSRAENTIELVRLDLTEES